MAEQPSDTTKNPEVDFSPRSRRASTLWSLFFSYANSVLVLVRNLALVPLYLHYIETAEYGAWLATGGVLGYLMVVDFGLMGVLSQQAAVAYGAKDSARLQGLLGTGLTIAAALCGLVMVLGVVVSPFVPMMFHLKGEMAGRLTLCFLIVALANGLSLLGFAASGVLQSLQRSFVPGLLNVVAEVCSLSVTVVLLFQGWGLYAIAWGLAVRSTVAVLGNFSRFLWVFRVQMGLRLKWVAADAKSLFRLCTYQFATRAAGQLLYGTDPFLVGVIVGPVAAAMYTLSIRAADTVRLFAGQFSGSLMPGMAHLHGEGDLKQLKSITVMALMVQTMLVAVGMGCVLAFNHDFVGLWIGSSNYAGEAVTVLISLAGIGALIGGVAYNIVYAMGGLPSLTRVTWLEVLVKMPLLIVLVYVVGLWGAATASLVSTTCVANVFIFTLLLRNLKFQRPEMRDLACTLGRILLPPILLAVAARILLPPTRSWRVFAIEAISYGVVALASMALAERRLFSIVRQLWIRRGGYLKASN